LAVIVDAVLDVRALDAKSLEAPPTFFRGSAADAMRGMTRRDESLVVVLDVDRLFAPDFFRVAEASPDEQRVVT
jgi:chemotaxis signal transduction protein